MRSLGVCWGLVVDAELDDMVLEFVISVLDVRTWEVGVDCIRRI